MRRGGAWPFILECLFNIKKYNNIKNTSPIATRLIVLSFFERKKLKYLCARLRRKGAKFSCKRCLAASNYSGVRKRYSLLLFSSTAVFAAFRFKASYMN